MLIPALVAALAAGGVMYFLAGPFLGWSGLSIEGPTPHARSGLAFVVAAVVGLLVDTDFTGDVKIVLLAMPLLAIGFIAVFVLFLAAYRAWCRFHPEAGRAGEQDFATLGVYGTISVAVLLFVLISIPTALDTYREAGQFDTAPVCSEGLAGACRLETHTSVAGARVEGSGRNPKYFVTPVGFGEVHVNTNTNGWNSLEGGNAITVVSWKGKVAQVISAGQTMDTDASPDQARFILIAVPAVALFFALGMGALAATSYWFWRRKRAFARRELMLNPNASFAGWIYSSWMTGYGRRLS